MPRVLAALLYLLAAAVARLPWRWLAALGDAFLQRVRAAHGDASRVTQIRAEAAGARQLFKWLQGGGVVGILPDQQPKQGDGEFAPFFGRPALTMSLAGRLASRTGASVLI